MILCSIMFILLDTTFSLYTWCAHMPIFGQHNNKCKMYISFRYLQHQNSIICRMHIYNIVFGWLLVASCSQCIVVCGDDCIYQVGGIMPYFCNHPSTFAIKYMQFQVMIDLVWFLHIPTTYPLDSWPTFGAINDAIISHCDNCWVYIVPQLVPFQ